LQKILGEKGGVIATLICGDNYFAENTDEASEEGLKLITIYEPDFLIAGPAFEAGRYGIACGAICKIANERLGIPAVTGMFEENPGVGLYRKDVYICRTGRSAVKMVENLAHMVNLAFKLLSGVRGPRLVSGKNIGRPSEDGYFPRYTLENEYAEKTAAERGVDMLIAKLKGIPFKSEVETPKFEKITSPPRISKGLKSCEIALICDGGLVPSGNPDKIRGRSNEIWKRYEIERIFPYPDVQGHVEIAHTGYATVHVKENPNRLVPVDVMRDLEKEGLLGKLHPYFYSTSGNATTQDSCKKMGEEIADRLKKNAVDGAILTST